MKSSVKATLFVLYLCGIFLEAVNSQITIPLHPRQKVHAADKDKPGVPITNDDLVEYYGRLQIGSPQQPIDAVFDSAISWTLIVDSECTDCHPCSNTYSSWLSENYRSNGTHHSIHYSTGEKHHDIAGIISADNMTVDKLQAYESHFILVQSEGDIFMGWRASGFVGLSPEVISDHPNYINLLKKQGVIENRIWAMRLSQVPNDDASEITFGAINTKYADESSIVWQPNHNSKIWLMKTSRLSFGSIEIKQEHEYMQILTNENHFRMNRQVFEPYERYLRETFEDKCTYDDISYLFECTTNSTSLSYFPTFKIETQTFTISVPPSIYVKFYKNKGKETYQAKIQIEVIPPEKIDYDGIGTQALAQYYVVFDIDNNRIGFSYIKEDKKGTSAVTVLLTIVIIVVALIVLGGGGLLIFARIKTGAWPWKSKASGENIAAQPQKAKLNEKPLLLEDPNKATSL